MKKYSYLSFELALFLIAMVLFTNLTYQKSLEATKLNNSLNNNKKNEVKYRIASNSETLNNSNINLKNKTVVSVFNYLSNTNRNNNLLLNSNIYKAIKSKENSLSNANHTNHSNNKNRKVVFKAKFFRNRINSKNSNTNTNINTISSTNTKSNRRNIVNNGEFRIGKLTSDVKDFEFNSILNNNEFYVKFNSDRMSVYNNNDDDGNYTESGINDSKCIYYKDILPLVIDTSNNKSNIKEQGIEELGKCLEGYCLKINYKTTDSENEKNSDYYGFCLDSETEMADFYSTLIDLLIDHESRNLETLNNSEENKNKNSFNNSVKTENVINSNNSFTNITLQKNINDISIPMNQPQVSKVSTSNLSQINNNIYNTNVNNNLNTNANTNNELNYSLEKEDYLALNLNNQLTDTISEVTLNTNTNNVKNIKSKYTDITDKNSIKSKKSVHWITKQNWSTCSKDCGGGVQSLKRECTEINACEGEDTIFRECNMSPCSLVSHQYITKEPIVKMLPISDRPQRYKECVVKEIDMEVIDISNDNSNDSKRNYYRIPSRVVMDTSQIKVIKGRDNRDIKDNFSSNNNSNASNNNSSILLQEIRKIRPYKEDTQHCLEISDYYSKNQIVICVLPVYYNDSEKILKEWEKQILLFRDECVTNKEYFDEVREYNNEIDDVFNDPEVRLAIKRAKEKKLKKIMNKSNLKKQIIENKEESKILKKAQIMALKAFEKEILFEQRMEREELMRQMNEINNADDRITIEEEKRYDLQQLRELENNDDDNQYNKTSNINDFNSALQSTSSDQNINDMVAKMKSEVNNNIKESRSKFMKKLENMKAIHQRNLNKKHTKVIELKTEIAVDALKAESNGDQYICYDYSKREKELQRKSYCNKKVVDDVELNTQCKKQFYFCNICCENEFGAVYFKERSACYSRCDMLDVAYDDSQERNDSNSSTFRKTSKDEITLNKK